MIGRKKISIIAAIILLMAVFCIDKVYAETGDTDEKLTNEVENVETSTPVEGGTIEEPLNQVSLDSSDTTETTIEPKSRKIESEGESLEKVFESSDAENNNGNVTHASGVTDEMANSSYWADKLGEEADKLLLNSEEIETINQEIIDGSGTGVFDLTKIEESKTQEARKISLVNSIDSDFNYMVRNYPDKDRKLYVDGELIENNIEYIDNMKQAVLNTGFENNDEKVQLYAVGVKRTEIRMYPTNAVWGYDKATDPDDESVNSALEVNEPFVIRAKCTINGEMFYWGLSNNCNGWVNANHVAICDSKEQWLDAWKVAVNGKDFIVVTQDCITLEPSSSNPETSNVELKIGTVLKLVPSDKIPQVVNDRGTWHNYVVYLPTRDENGKYVKSYALISEHNKVSVGYLPLTQRNVLDVAFTCAGNRYGWGGMIGAMDCSLYAKSIYKCFGLDLPRNTSAQPKVPNRAFSFEGMDDAQREATIESLPIGTILFFSGHAMVYIGNENGTSYVISDTGSLSDSVGETEVRSMYSVIINPLTVRRKNGSKWISNLTFYLTFGNINNSVSSNDVYVAVSEANMPKANVTYGDGITFEMSDSNYWKNMLNNKNEVLMTPDEIDSLNKKVGKATRYDINSKKILVVTQDRIILEPSILQPDISKVELPLGTVLELVPEDKIPTNIAERGPWDNYVVYLPVTLEDGTVEKKYALISEHYNVSIGYLKLTPENIIDVAFRCLGDSFELMDNDKFIEALYSCFGIQFLSDIDKIAIKDNMVKEMDAKAKTEFIKSLPVGSILMMPDQKVIYLGSEGDTIYSIGSIKNVDGRTMKSIILGTLGLKNDDKTTWLESVSSVVDFSSKEQKIPYYKQYVVLEGADQVINPNSNSDLAVRFNIEYDRFARSGKVYVDNNLLDASMYVSGAGSTIVSLKNAFLKTLAVGEHTLRVEVDDGDVSTIFTIAGQQQSDGSSSSDNSGNQVVGSTNASGKIMSSISKGNTPKTGDNVFVYLGVLILSIFGFAISFISDKFEV